MRQRPKKFVFSPSHLAGVDKPPRRIYRRSDRVTHLCFGKSFAKSYLRRRQRPIQGQVPRANTGQGLRGLRVSELS